MSTELNNTNTGTEVAKTTEAPEVKKEEVKVEAKVEEAKPPVVETPKIVTPQPAPTNTVFTNSSLTKSAQELVNEAERTARILKVGEKIDAFNANVEKVNQYNEIETKYNKVLQDISTKNNINVLDKDNLIDVLNKNGLTKEQVIMLGAENTLALAEKKGFQKQYEHYQVKAGIAVYDANAVEAKTTTQFTNKFSEMMTNVNPNEVEYLKTLKGFGVNSAVKNADVVLANNKKIVQKLKGE